MIKKRIYTAEQKERAKEYYALYWKTHKNNNSTGYHKKYFQLNKDEIQKKTLQYYHRNKVRLNKKRTTTQKNKWHTNVDYKLQRILSIGIRTYLKRRKILIDFKPKYREYLGCSIKELKQHLESKFKEGMSWNNWALKGWHIDHIRPMSSFNLKDEKEMAKCWNYINLQPLWASENLRKSNIMIL